MKALSGLYLVTPGASIPLATLAGQVATAIDAGARLVQYRDKTASPVERHRRVEALLACCRRAGVPLIVNDDVELAAAVGADGVHLGRDDRDPSWARARLGRGALIGVSCYADLARARAAAQAGADYLAFGSFFASPTKPGAARAAPALLGEARTLRRPLVAIGGITPENGASLIAAGADMLAVVTGVFAAPDVAAATRAYTRLFPTEESR
ncbi:thiamine-phosphate pyrophosphorylase [Thioflavicoccus mobilis 8321]|uniref:Thiamine-phosphate synthase n=1 Tax=Thioflavicoccus mobilis 8321 TaxID=765912 RepID=L0GSH9_9GAMM|nr:thiamine phosphate synthase [Thioflavicoccus mobilis]AGA88946.1 thiamine-phosphate pyrophosphorylase [Thioflavicoccus mobilis 8321]